MTPTPDEVKALCEDLTDWSIELALRNKQTVSRVCDAAKDMIEHQARRIEAQDAKDAEQAARIAALVSVKENVLSLHEDIYRCDCELCMDCYKRLKKFDAALGTKGAV